MYVSAAWLPRNCGARGIRGGCGGHGAARGVIELPQAHLVHERALLRGDPKVLDGLNGKDRGNIGMIQRGKGFCFPLESFQARCVPRKNIG